MKAGNVGAGGLSGLVSDRAVEKQIFTAWITDPGKGVAVLKECSEKLIDIPTSAGNINVYFIECGQSDGADCWQSDGSLCHSDICLFFDLSV